MVVLQPLALFPLSLPTYHNLRHNSWRSWVCYEHHFLGETVQLFVSDSPRAAVPFTFSLSPIPCCMIILRTGFDRRGCLWAELSLSSPHRFVTGADARILPAVNSSPLEQPARHLMEQCQGFLRPELLQSDQSLSPRLFSFPACSHLCFFTALQPDHSVHLSVASSHLEKPFDTNRDSAS